MVYVLGIVATVIVMLAVLLFLNLVPASPQLIGGMFIALLVAGGLAHYRTM